MHISSSYDKIMRETNFRTREIPQSGSKAKEGEKKKKEKERLDGNNNCQLRIATPPRVAHAKPPGPTMASYALLRNLGWRTQSRLGQNNL